MNPSDPQQPAPLDIPGLDLAELAHALAGIEQEPAVRFAQLLPKVVRRVLGQGAEADQALADGGFVLNDSTVVMRLNEDTDHIEFFCDIGVPQRHAREDAFRVALELNLCRTYPGITLGVHPVSGRLVATTAVHSLLVADDEVCLQALDTLTQQVRRLRDSGALPLADEAAEGAETGEHALRV
jgi:hypothetical protein